MQENTNNNTVVVDYIIQGLADCSLKQLQTAHHRLSIMLLEDSQREGQYIEGSRIYVNLLYLLNALIDKKK